MRTVHIFVYSTITGRAAAGAGGYVLALDKDGRPDDLTAVKDIFALEDTTGIRAQLQIITKAVERITEQVSLHVWTEIPLIASAVRMGWIDKWTAAGFEGVKNAEEWQRLITMFEGVGMDIHRTEWHIGEPHPYRGWLSWECRRIKDRLKSRKEGQRKP